MSCKMNYCFILITYAIQVVWGIVEFCKTVQLFSHYFSKFPAFYKYKNHEEHYAK